MERGPLRPPRTGLRPLRLPLSLAIGAKPTSLAMALLERCQSRTTRPSGVRGALDRTEDLIETGPQRIVVD